MKPLARQGQSAYLGHGCCEDNNLVELANSLHELVDTGPFDHINIMVVTLNFHRYCEVGLVQDLGRSASKEMEPAGASCLP